MAGRHPALTALVLLAVTLSAPAEADRTSDIIGAVKGQAAKVQGAVDMIVKGATQSAHPLAGGSGLGVKGPALKRHRYSKKCGTQAPTAKQLAAVQPVLNAAAKLAAEEDAARSGARLPCCTRVHTTPVSGKASKHCHVQRHGRCYFAKPGGMLMSAAPSTLTGVAASACRDVSACKRPVSGVSQAPATRRGCWPTSGGRRSRPSVCTGTCCGRARRGARATSRKTPSTSRSRC